MHICTYKSSNNNKLRHGKILAKFLRLYSHWAFVYSQKRNWIQFLFEKQPYNSFTEKKRNCAFVYFNDITETILQDV